MITDWLFLALLSAPLAVVALVDARTGRIPDAANAAILALGVARALGLGGDVLAARLLDAGLTVLLLLLLRRLYRRARGREGLGLGDVKFLGAAALWTGLAGLPFLLLLASLAALLGVALGGLLKGRGTGLSTRLRFGPYLAAALFALVLAEILWPGLF